MTAHIMVDARRRYLEEFRRQVSGGPEFHVEPALRTAGGAVAVEGALLLPTRVDLMRRSDRSIVVVNTPQPRSGVQASSVVSGVAVSIESPLWDSLKIRLRSCAPGDFAALKSWFHAWFDEEDHNKLNDDGFYGVVHFLSDPERVGSDTVLTVDLGSAPIMAFDQLLLTLAGYQPERVEIA